MLQIKAVQLNAIEIVGQLEFATIFNFFGFNPPSPCDGGGLLSFTLFLINMLKIIMKFQTDILWMPKKTEDLQRDLSSVVSSLLFDKTTRKAILISNFL